MHYVVGSCSITFEIILTNFEEKKLKVKKNSTEYFFGGH